MNLTNSTRSKWWIWQRQENRERCQATLTLECCAEPGGEPPRIPALWYNLNLVSDDHALLKVKTEKCLIPPHSTTSQYSLGSCFPVPQMAEQKSDLTIVSNAALPRHHTTTPLPTAAHWWLTVMAAGWPVFPSIFLILFTSKILIISKCFNILFNHILMALANDYLLISKLLDFLRITNFMSFPSLLHPEGRHPFSARFELLVLSPCVLSPTRRCRVRKLDSPALYFHYYDKTRYFVDSIFCFPL